MLVLRATTKVLRSLPGRLPAPVTRRLQRLDVPPGVIAAETATLTPAAAAG